MPDRFLPFVTASVNRHLRTPPRAEATGEPQAAGLPPDESAEDQGAEKRKQHDLVFKTVLHDFFGDLVELVEPDFAARVDLTNVEFPAFLAGQTGRDLCRIERG